MDKRKKRRRMDGGMGQKGIERERECVLAGGKRTLLFFKLLNGLVSGV